LSNDKSKPGIWKNYEKIVETIIVKRGGKYRMDKKNQTKLEALQNPFVERCVQEAIELCQPEKVSVITDAPQDIHYVRNLALRNGEEKPLAIPGHTIHFDGYDDQGRDKENTRYLLSHPVDWGIDIKWISKEEGLHEVTSYLRGSMRGKEMLVRFFSLGPTDSAFSIPSLQITDSAYVAHSEDLLYRNNYEGFKSLNRYDSFFYFLHSAGRLQDNVSIDVDKRRIYIDLEENRVYSVNNQYAGNSLGLKKLAFRLAINKANQEGWLAEHMFIMGVHHQERTTYFTGAFPSGCGKTSTAMLPGQTIIGDDIAYLKKVNGDVRAANVERGIFGIIRDVNREEDPLIYQALTTPGEVIFSNVLIQDGKPYWLGMREDIPEEGFNHSGKLFIGKKDSRGNEIDPSHKNARYTIRLSELDNLDPRAEDPAGVPIRGIVYGGRDSDTSVPIAEALSWFHGVFLGATVESETTAATLGQQGVRKHNPMANLDFISVPFITYLKNHLSFPNDLDTVPRIFATNYFLKNEQGNFITPKIYNQLWILWAERRINQEFEAIETPIGFIPKYRDLKALLWDKVKRDFSKEEYIRSFSIQISKYLEKMERMKKIFDQIEVPKEIYSELKAQTSRLEEARKINKEETISPFEME